MGAPFISQRSHHIQLFFLYVYKMMPLYTSWLNFIFTKVTSQGWCIKNSLRKVNKTNFIVSKININLFHFFPTNSISYVNFSFVFLFILLFSSQTHFQLFTSATVRLLFSPSQIHSLKMYKSLFSRTEEHDRDTSKRVEVSDRK